MIDNIQYFFAFIFFSWSEPAVVIVLAVVFYFGRVFGGWTRSFNVWKYLALGYFGILIFRPLEEVGIVFGGVFILGAASMYLDLFRGIFSWAGGLGDVFSALRSRSAYEDIRRLEREIEALKSQLKASQMSPAAAGGSAQQASWRAQAQARKAASTSRSAGGGASSASNTGAGSTQGTTTGSRNGNRGRRPSSNGRSHKAQSRVKDGPTGGQKSSTGQSSGNAGRARPNGSQSGSRQQGTSQSQSRQQSGNAGVGSGYQISAALRDKYLQTLELMPGKNYTQAELRAAWRKMAFKAHPDKGGSAAMFSAVQEAYKALT